MDTSYIVFNIAALVLSVASFIWGIYNFRQTKKLEHESKQLAFFSEYTKRYQDIMLNIYRNPNQIVYQRLYFDLCSEEYYLFTKRLLPKEVWGIWLDGMKMQMKQQNFQSAWRTFSVDYDADFRDFVNKKII